MIDLKAIKEKALRANQPPTHQTAWLPDEETVSADYVQYMFSLTPDVVLKLLRIIEVQGEALQDILDEAQAICFDHTFVGSCAATALEQVSKILEEK